jgi:hypothetical protein
MIRKTLLVLLPVVLVVSLASAGTQTIVLKDGPKYTGEVTKTNVGYQIKLPNGEFVEFAKDTVKSVSAATDPSAEYKKRLEKIDASKADGHIEIGIWAHDGGYLDIAYAEYLAALKIQPDSERIKTRLGLVTDQLNDLAKAGTKGGEVTTKPDDPAQTQNLVSVDDMYKIRMYELKRKELKSTPPAIELDRKSVV